VKLLLDECVTQDLRGDLAGHEVHTVADAGLKGLENGELLKAAAGIYEVLITVDQNIPYQQNLGGLPIAILILAARRNSYTRLKPLVPRALAALEIIKPGEIVRIEA
jgi:predicted nuclease of predicted toxin-antitoxin system